MAPRVRSPHAFWQVAVALVLVASLHAGTTVAQQRLPDGPYSPIHEPGHCVWYGECGKTINPFIPGPLNCLYNGPAKPVAGAANETAFRALMADFCGPKYANVEFTCCDYIQLNTLVESLGAAKQFVYSCPACWNNFLEFFCDLTCSTDTAMYANITKITRDPSNPTNGEVCIAEAQVFVDPYFGERFYNSCANVTFSQSNTPAMLFIGGGAENYTEFLSFLGKKQFLGSPFNILFPLPETHDLTTYRPFNGTVHNCFDEDENRCTCVDCFQACPPLRPAEAAPEVCYVGVMRCLSFALLITLSTAFLFVVIGLLVLRRRSSGYTYLDQSAVSINDNNVAPKEWVVYAKLQRWYYHLGLWVATHPGTVMLLTLLFVGGFSAGLIKFSVETDPVALWNGDGTVERTRSAETSITRVQKDYFDQTFGPFYRTQQVIMSTNDGSSIVSAVNLEKVFFLQNNITTLTTVDEAGNEVTFYDLCFRPLGLNGNVNDCVIQSVAGYWQNSLDTFDKNRRGPQGSCCTMDPDNQTICNPECGEEYVLEHFFDCTGNPTFTGNLFMVDGCLPPFQDPIKPPIVLGGYDRDEDYGEATALVITFLINNSLNETYLDIAYDWEEEMVAYMKDALLRPEFKNLRITFYTESGVEIELARESASDLVTVAISYIVMLLYVSIALGRFSSVKRLVIDTKFTLGIAGVLICVCSVLVSVGIFSVAADGNEAGFGRYDDMNNSLAGVKTSLIIAEVIPFLVLAVGVDNIFILVNQFERYEKNTPVENRVAEALSEVGPSITLSAFAETVAFGLGAVVSMPAVNSFAAYSAVAIFVDFLLQITCFLTLLGLDARRAESRRMDCVPCVPINTDAPPADYRDQGFLKSFTAKYYAPGLLSDSVKPVVMVFFSVLLAFLISAIPYLELGLDQSIALPQDSYLIPYFVDQASLLKVGAPVYFVIQGNNVTTLEGQIQQCATFVECETYSVPNVIVLESSRPEYSTVALRPSLWLDDFINWLDPSYRRCCRSAYNETTDTTEFCQADDPNPLCVSCYTQAEYDELTLAPNGIAFMEKLKWWLSAIPGENCVRAGAGAYADALLPNYETTSVEAAHFRSYHTVIQTQAEYINAYEAALRVCDQVEADNPGSSCFPYTIFYVYFEQYLNIVGVMVVVLSLAAIAVFLVTWAVLGSAVSALFVVGVVAMIVVDMIGVMALWRISLNAVSLVNLVMALGISVEFCSHLVRAFTVTTGSRQARATFALVDVGASVFSGITVTKFAGVVVLAFAQSEIFVVYYFRMYLSTVILGFLHGLVFLPVLLSYIGPQSRGGKSAEESMEALSAAADKQSRMLEQRQSLYGSTTTVVSPR